MKNILIGALILTSLSVFAADKPVLGCSTSGDGLAYLEMSERSDGKAKITIRFTEADEETPKAYDLRTGLKNIKKGDSDTLVGYGSKAESFGGANTDSLLIRVLQGGKKAYLGVKDTVFELNCFKME